MEELGRLAALIAAAATGHPEARAVVEAALTTWAADPGTAALATALRRLVDGADDPALDGDLPPEHAELLAAVRRLANPASPTDVP